jgi:SAM-dependent methyltransferase
MNYQVVEETLKAGYREVMPRYRRDDEIEVTTENHRRIHTQLRQICSSFPHPISVLDVGCGTGRYFHCLANVRQLTGIDISDDMLSAAKDPVRGEQLSIPNITLARANAYTTDFPAGSFHFIYSLGMFGNGCPVTTEICNKFYQWLVPGGKLLFNTVDLAGLPLSYRIRRKVRGIIYPMLPGRYRNILDERAARQPFFGLSRRGLKRILHESRFPQFEINSYRCLSPLWNGRHLECLAVRPA